eukprot:1114192-Pyramimonas_sp.AAC.1
MPVPSVLGQDLAAPDRDDPRAPTAHGWGHSPCGIGAGARVGPPNQWPVAEVRDAAQGAVH